MGLFSRRAGGGWAAPDFTPVQVPRSGLSVFDVFAARSSGFQRLGVLTDLLEGEHDLSDGQHVQRGLTVAGTKFVGDKNVKLGLGLTVLNQIAACMGQSVSADGSRSKGETVDYEYVGVTRDQANIFALDEWVRGADLRTDTAVGAELAVSERIYIAAAAEFAPTVRISIASQTGTELAVRTAGAVDGQAEGQRTVERGLTVALTGTQPVCIAMMLVRLFCNGQGFWLTAEPHGSGGWIRSSDRPYELFDGDQLAVDVDHG